VTLRSAEFIWTLLFTLIWGCSLRESDSTSHSGLQILDDLGRPITLSRPAKRIASLSPANTEILWAIGCGDRVVLRDRASSYPPEATRTPATNAFELSPEHIAGFSPEILLLSHMDAGRLEALDKIGLQVAIFDPRTLDKLLQTISIMGILCGANDEAQRIASDLRRRADNVARAVAGRPRPRVTIEVDGSDPLKPWVAGPGSLVDHMVHVAGGQNAMARLSRPFVQTNAEEVLAARPDVILLMGVENRGEGKRRVRDRPAWSALETVQRGRIIDGIHADLLSRPGPRLFQGLEALARALHPEVAWP
jgi:iron complex transport system substrate-binding protein